MSYKIMEDGIKNLDTGACIPADIRNRDYRAFLVWCSAGNTPEDQYTTEELAVKAQRELHEVALKEIKNIDRALLKLIIRMFQALAANGHVTKADIGDAYIDGALALRDKLAIVEANE